MGVLRITKTVFDAIRAHGERTYPEESCGVLLGIRSAEGWWIEIAIETRNARAGAARDRYSIPPGELIEAAAAARRRGLEIGGFYHSHPGGPAQWSTADLAEAQWPGCAYVITGVAEGKAVVTNAFLLAGSTGQDKRFEPARIEIAATGDQG